MVPAVVMAQAPAEIDMTQPEAEPAKTEGSAPPAGEESEAATPDEPPEPAASARAARKRGGDSKVSWQDVVVVNR
jgi:hypothetical protein